MPIRSRRPPASRRLLPERGRRLPHRGGVRTFRQDAGPRSHGCGVADWGIPRRLPRRPRQRSVRSERPDANSFNFGELSASMSPSSAGFLREEIARFQQTRPSGIFLLPPRPARQDRFLASAARAP